MANYKFLGNHIVLTNEANETIYDENDQMIILAAIVECKGKHTGKFTVINRIGLSQVEVWDALTQAEDNPTTKFNNLFFAEKYAEMMVANMFNELCALEAFVDAANQLLHVEIAAAAEADAMQYEASETIAQNDGIDFVQVYIDGLPHEYATNELMQPKPRYEISEFLDASLPVNEVIKLNGDLLYLEEIILDTCFCHGGGVWEFWANPAFPDEKSLLMIYLCTTPVKARKKPRYPQESDYYDYRDGGDGYTSENLVLDF
jgi:hypothetical protein